MSNNCAAIVIAAKHHELFKVKDTRGTTNTVGALRCKFDFRTDDWLHSAKTATFCNGDAILHPEVIDDAISVPLDTDNECPVPYEVLIDTLPYSVGVWGITDSGLRIVSNWLVYNAQNGCYTQGNAPADPEPTIYEQILTTSHGAVNTANKVLNMANNGEFDGEDGVSIIKSEINNKGELVLTYSNGQSSNLGKVVGVNGINGVDGVDGKDGVDGTNGKDGATGNGIAKIEKTDSDGLTDTYTITFTDGSTTTFAVENGVNGKDGADGKDGKDGKDGADGKTPYIGENGNWWIGDTDTNVKAEGTDGKDGVDGTDGKSAYQYAQDGGYSGTEAEFAEDINPDNIKSVIEQILEEYIDEVDELIGGED